MIKHFNKIAAVLVGIIGLMAVFAGGQVLLGSLPDYYVISWLPVYNFLMGMVSVFVTAVIVWKNTSLALPLAAVTFGLHAIVMLILQVFYRQVVAGESVMAMTVRLVFWAVILTLLIVQRNKQ